jgi:TRAP-type C4-dicarboxylate transport system substrate-binding protein
MHLPSPLIRQMARCACLALALGLLALCGPARAETPAQTYHLKVVGGLANVSQFKAFEKPFWEIDVPKITNGRIVAQIHPFDQSGFAGQEMLQLMRLGVVSFGTALLAQVAADEPELNVVDLPILNPDMQSLRDTVRIYRPHLYEILARRYGIELLAIYAYPAQVLFCAEEFRTLHDLAGRRVRTSSVGQSEMMASLQAIPIQIPFANVVASFRRGVIDCAITGTRSGAEIGLPEVTSYISPLAISWGLSFFGANREAWMQLPPEVRDPLRENIEKLEKAIWDAADRETAGGLACNIGDPACASGRKYNMKLVPIARQDEVERQRILVKTILPKWIQRCGPDCAAAWNSTLGSHLGIELAPEADEPP